MVLLGTVIFQSCTKDDELSPEMQSSILPSTFKVDIPSSLSSNATVSYKNSEIDTLQGNDIYQHLRTFIAVGEGAADIVGGIIFTIAIYDINQPMSFSFTSDEDGRIKNVVVEENATYEGVDYEFVLTMVDAASEFSVDGGKALQIFWNRNPINGVAILKPFNINRTENQNAPNAIFRIDYSEKEMYGYEKHMIVYITGLPMPEPLENPYAVKTLKMFVGRNGDVVDVYGNTEHPNALFFNGETGFDWAFVASGSDSRDIAVAEVGLPGNELDSDDREVLLEDNSIRNVFTAQILEVWPTIDPEVLDAYLYNTNPPGYFNEFGFVQGGEAPSVEYQLHEERINQMTPYNPLTIHEMVISFQ